MTGPRALVRRHWGDALVVLALVAAVAQLAFHIDWGQSDDVVDLDEASRWLAIPFAAAWTLPLLLRRRSGLVAGLAVFIAIATLAVIDADATDSVVLFVTILAASAAIGLHEDRRRAAAGGIVALAALLVLIRASNGLVTAGDVFVGVIFAWGPLAGGQVVRSITTRNALLEARTEELERLQAEQAAAAVSEERTRIANELHDVIAQGVSVMTLQASGARLLLHSDPERAREAILAVEETGRQALDETRRLLGILRRDSSAPQLAPQPGVASLQALVERARSDGLAVSLTVEGEAQPLPASVSVTAYHVVDETLTAAGAQAGVTGAAVTIRYEPGALELEIADDGWRRGGDRPTAAQVALWERVHVHGGTVEMSRGADGLTRVKVHLPLEATE